MLAAQMVGAQDLHFYAQPYQVHEGDAVLFHYLDAESVVPLEEIASWSWDFDNDGQVDAQGTGSEGINATWYATFDESKAQGGTYAVTPKLKIVDTNGTVYTQIGITEDSHGVGDEVDPELFILVQSAGNDKIVVDFSGGPRLATAGTEIRFYADVNLLQDGQITGYAWDLDGDGNTDDSSAANPTHTYPVGSENEYDITLTVSYTLDSDPGNTHMLSETKPAYINIQDDKGSLSLGRAYRKGFPHEYGWEDILEAYSAKGSDGDKYVYYHHFADAYDELKNQLVSDHPDDAQQQQMAEIANECLQGQVMLGNQRLIEALRIKYPRMLNFDPENPPEVLPVPPGVREETEAIDVALLDLYSGLLYPAQAIHEYGMGVLRSRAEQGNEPFPQFPQYISFVDSTLSPFEVPIKNEYWQLTTCLERMGLGSVEKAKKLFKLSLHDETAREEAKEECKKTGMQSYLGMALLAAGQDEDDFAANQGNLLLADLKNSRDLFEAINQGLTPLMDNGDFIPNESFASIYLDAQEAVADAREAEINARQEDRTYDQYQAALRNELLAQHNSYITPLKNLTGLDPALYNNLQTVDDQKDFRNTIRTRVNALIADYPNADPSTLGELGELILAELDQAQAVQISVNNVANQLKRVDVVKWANTKITDVQKDNLEVFMALDVLDGMADGMMHQISGLAISLGAAGGALEGLYSSRKTLLSTLQNIDISDVEAEKEIRGLLIEMNNLGIAIDRANNQLKQTQLHLDNALSRMDRMIEDLAHTRNTAADLYFQDPSFRVVVSDAMRRAESEMDYAIDKLYRLAKTLEYEWTEGYQNPLTIPVNCNEPASLENPLFDKFTQLTSLFNVQSADETKDYLDALKAWDSKLRRINVTSVRGPNHAGPISAEPISLREDILGFRTDSGTMTMEESLEAFRNYLKTHRVDNHYNVFNPSLELDFATTIADNRFFPATGSRWNMRINSVSVELYAESGFSTKQVAEVDLIESGVVALRRFWADPPEADDLKYLHFQFGFGEEDRTAYGIAVPAKINGAMGGRPSSEFLAMGLADRPIGATQWILKLDTENPSNADLDFSKLKDIIIKFTYTYGNPPEFAGF